MMTLKSFTTILLFVFFFNAFSTQAYAQNQCQTFFSKYSVFQKIKSYGQEVVQSKGLRLFLKNSEYDKDQTKWFGLLSKQKIDVRKKGIRKYLSSIISYIPRKLGRALSREEGYVFTPFEGTYNITLRQPVEYLTSKISNKKMEPAFFFKFPILIAGSLATYTAMDAVYVKQLQAHSQQEITEHAVEYDKAIQSDYRYSKIKSALARGEISKAEAQQEAYLISLAYSQYFQSRDSMDAVPNLESEMKLLKHYLFAHLENVITNGVKPASIKEGYYVPKQSEGQLSDAQKIELFKNNHQRYLKYQIVAEMVQESSLWADISQSPKMKALVDSIIEDPFTAQLYALRDSKKITNDELQYYLQEDVYWQNRFQDWKTIGVTKLKKVDGQYTNQALTLSDIRQEVLTEIALN